MAPKELWVGVINDLRDTPRLVCARPSKEEAEKALVRVFMTDEKYRKVYNMIKAPCGFDSLSVERQIEVICDFMEPNPIAWMVLPVEDA